MYLQLLSFESSFFISIFERITDKISDDWKGKVIAVLVVNYSINELF